MGKELDPETGEEIQDPAAGDQDDQQDQEEEKVPVSAVKGIREELNQVKAQLQASQDQVRLYQANAPQQQPQSQEGTQSKPDQVLEGMEDDDVITVADARKLARNLKAEVGTVLSELSMAARVPDYEEVISKHLPKVLQANPALAQAIRTSANPAILAYELGKTDPEYVKTKAQAAQQQVANQVEKNLKEPGSASAAGGGGGGLSQADQFARMSDDDLEKHIANVKNRG